MTTSITKIALSLLLLIGWSLNSMAQETRVVQDFETWTSASFRYKVNKKLRFGISENLRLNTNSTAVDQHFLELQAGFKPIKNLTTKVEWRLGGKNRTDSFQTFTRWFFAGIYKVELGRFTVEPRLAYQSRNQYLGARDLTDVDQHFRYRIGLAYNIKNWKLDPETSFELFRRRDVEDGPESDKFRIRLGTSIDMGKKSSLKIFMAYEDELNKKYPLQSTILGVKYTFDTKRKKKDKE